jgi:hypothetical protein
MHRQISQTRATRVQKFCRDSEHYVGIRATAGDGT